jgi:hypothetical protein
MNDAQAKELCLALMRADSEDEVVRILTEAGYWDEQAYWRYYGDRETNFNSAGNQQAKPDSALIEKIINSVDARLMNECLVRGIDPAGNAAPQSIRAAVAAYFEEAATADKPHAGQMKYWSPDKRTQVARGITLAATGSKPPGKPCFSIADAGEGQTPEKMPDTLLSLDKSNKLRIPFVQGKFNMGGTGVLKFCGRRNLQLIVSRRNPAILRGRFDHPSDDQWGFTVVRREDPGDGRRSSVYTYLAPLGVLESKALPGHGGVLRFSSATMPIFPEGTNPYGREAEWGTLIKLYEYDAVGFRSNIVFSTPSLLSRMDLLLPDVALPIRLHECRDYRGHEGSFQTTLTGLGVRLEDDRAQNLEEGFPASCPLSAAGQEMTATIYAFKKGKAETYRKNEGVIFTLNGQTHGHFTPDFFRRKNVGLSYLADSILVVVDCSRFSGRAREDLFMNSRDRLSGGELRQELEDVLEDMLKQHQGLRALKERRRREETEERFADSKPLENILENLLKKSQTLASLFLPGARATNPFKPVKVQEEEKPYAGKVSPTFFKFQGKKYGDVLHRETAQNMRSRIAFETDAVNDYFSRSIDPGQFAIWQKVDGKDRPVRNYVGPNLQNGTGTLSVQLPEDCQPGDELVFLTSVTDASRSEPFENQFVVKVQPAAETSGGTSTRRKPSAKTPGTARDSPGGITLPNIIKVHEADWDKQSPPFDKYTALRIKDTGTDESNGAGDDKPTVYDFYVNVDNLYLKSEMKPPGTNHELLRNRFIYGNVLLGLALLHQEELDKKSRQAKQTEEENNDDENEPEEENNDDENEPAVNIEDRIAQFTRAIAPVLLPMIESLGGLNVAEIASADTAAGDAT